MTSKIKEIIKIRHKDKQIIYKNKWRLFSGYFLTVIVFPVMFSFVSLFILFVCTWEGLKMFCEEFVSTGKQIKWCHAYRLVCRNIKAVLTYEKKREEK